MFELSAHVTTAGDLGLVVPAEGMRRIAEQVERSIRVRLSNGLDANDLPAPALRSKRYERAKQNRHIPAIRNWRYTGTLLKSMTVLRAKQNQAVIGFEERPYDVLVYKTDDSGRRIFEARIKRAGASTNDVARMNNARCLQFAVSPKDMDVLMSAMETETAAVVMEKRA